MGVYDQAARYSAKQLDPTGFVRWLAPGTVGVWGLRGWVDTRALPFPGEADRTCDTVAWLESVAGTEPPLALVIEFEAETETDMLERLADYVLGVRQEVPAGPRREKYLVVGALLNLTGPPQPAVWDMTLAGLGGAGFHFQAIVRTLREESAAETLAVIARGDVSRCLLPWIPLMHGGGEPGIIEEWKRLASLEPDASRRATYGSLALVFAELSRRADVWRRALEGWNMQESQIVLEWQAQARAEGLIQKAREDLLRVLEVRFGIEVPAELRSRIEGESDLAVLRRWFDQALTVPSLTEFQAGVK